MANDAKQEQAPEQQPPADKTTGDLLAHLQAGGTPPGTLEMIREYQKAQPRATPAEVLEHLTVSLVTPGTLRKVGQWLYGETWDVAQPGVATNDVIAGLRQELANAREHAANLEAKNLLLTRERADLTRRNSAMTDQLQTGRVAASEPAPAPRPANRGKNR